MEITPVQSPNSKGPTGGEREPPASAVDDMVSSHRAFDSIPRHLLTLLAAAVPIAVSAAFLAVL